MKRDASIELYRCLCMFAVVLLHALDQGGYAEGHRGLDNLMMPGVVGFVFISGWFGIRFKWSSVAKLLGIGFGCWLTLAIVNWNFTSSFGIGGYWWFLWMYLALMALAPLVEPFVSEINGGGQICKVMPFLLVVFGWSYLATKVPFFKNWVPSVEGFSPFGVLTFLGVYVAARILSRVSSFAEATEDKDREKWRTRWLVCAAVVSGAACWFGFCHYNSPFALVLAGSLFLLIKRINLANSAVPLPLISRTIKTLVLFISPSMFSVYLLHTNSAGLGLLRQVESRLMEQGWNYYAMAFAVAGAIFVGGILLDLPRRMIALVARRVEVRMRNVE